MFGDVIICQFPFTSGSASKVRPALVLFDLQQDAIICRVTSVLYTGPLDVVLNDWRAAGLLKASTARLDRVVTAEKSDHPEETWRLDSRGFGECSDDMESPYEAVKWQ
jgi:hypothetical protein